MDGIVLELQREALSSNGDILSLLRKAYIIARKLDLKYFEEWVSCELNGYSSSCDVPPYRHVQGEVRAWNPSCGWIPVMFNAHESTFTENSVRDSITNLLDVYNKSQNDCAVMDFPDSINEYLNKYGSAPFPTKYRLQIPISQLFSIIESVRTSILDWTLVLEKSGIVGEGLQFSDGEKKIATENPAICNYVTNIFGNVSGSQFQQGTTCSDQIQ